MSQQRRYELLEHIESNGKLPPDMTVPELAELRDGGFMFVEGDEAHLTSLGEMELEDIHALAGGAS